MGSIILASSDNPQADEYPSGSNASPYALRGAASRLSIVVKSVANHPHNSLAAVE